MSLSTDSPKLPLVDLGFAISASAANSDDTFSKMKDTIKAIIDKYGKAKIHYSLIVFGDEALVKISFSDSFPTSNDLKQMVDVIPKQSGIPNMKKALEESRKMFERGTRPDAEKVLVVIVDNRSGSRSEEIKNAAKPLTDIDVSLVFVALGNDADPSQLGNATSDPQDVIEAPRDIIPTALGDEIMKQVLKGNLTGKALFNGST